MKLIFAVHIRNLKAASPGSCISTSEVPVELPAAAPALPTTPKSMHKQKHMKGEKKIVKKRHWIFFSLLTTSGSHSVQTLVGSW